MEKKDDFQVAQTPFLGCAYLLLIGIMLIAIFGIIALVADVGQKVKQVNAKVDEISKVIAPQQTKIPKDTISLIEETTNEKDHSN